MYKKPGANWTKHIDFMLFDTLFLNIAYVVSFLIRFPGEGLPYFSREYLGIAILYSISMLFSLLLLNNLSGVLKRGYYEEFVSVLILDIVSLALTVLVLYSLHISDYYSRILIILTAVLFLFLDYAVRIAYKKLVIRRMNERKNSENYSRTAFLVSNYEESGKLLESVQSDPFNSYKVCGIALCDCQNVKSDSNGEKVFTDLDDAAEFICREWIDEVFISSVEQTEAVKSFISKCAEMGIVVHSLIGIQEADEKRQYIEKIAGQTVITTAYSSIAPHQAFIKRTADIIFGVIGSLIAVVIGIFIGPIIYINSPGPVIFRQRRIGRNGKVFNVLKFRSMYLDAEERKKDYVAQNRVADGMMFKLDFDPRIIGNRILPDGKKKTGIGEFIRRTSLDEFPQFFNVLKGDMSLVGTRPPTVDEWEKYEFHHRARLAVKPGITGMWQVSGRSEITDFEQVVKLDTYYITHFRTSLDIKIFFKTILILLQRKGAM